MATRCSFDTKQEDHKDKVCHKDWNQSFYPGRPKLSTTRENLKLETCCKNIDWQRNLTTQEALRQANKFSETKRFDKILEN